MEVDTKIYHVKGHNKSDLIMIFNGYNTDNESKKTG